MSLHLAKPWPVPIGLLFLAVVLLLVVIAYRGLGRATDRRSRLIFLGARLGAALLLTLLLLEPVLVRDRLQTESLSVVVLVDTSRSMSVPDSYGGRARNRVAGEFLTREDTGLLDLLGDDFRIVPLAFDSTSRAAKDAELRGGAAPEGRLTDLTGALLSVKDSVPPADTAAIVLLTDGAENGGRDAREAARDLAVPVYAVGFGSRAGAGEARRDLAILSVDAPETAFMGNAVVAEAAIRSTGYDLADPGNRRVRVVLTADDREIASERVELTEEGAPVRVPLRFVPEGTGPRTYRVSVPERGDEAILENNSRSFSLEVREHRATVLYFDASLRWEAKFLRDFLARDPAIDLTSVLHSGQGRLVVNGPTHGADLSRGFPATAEDLARFDVVILGDVEAAALDPDRLEALRARVESGGGLLTLGGYHAYGAGGYAGTALAEALPVTIDAADGQTESELTLSLTPDGRVHPALSGLGSYFNEAEPPRLKGASRVGGARLGAQVLLTGRADGGEDIVLAVQRYGEGRVAAFTGDTSWLWFRSPVWGGPDGLFGQFWGQLLRWLLEEEPEVERAGEPVVVFTDRPSYRIGEVVRIRAQVTTADGDPVSDADVRGRLAGPGRDEEIRLEPLARVPGHYEIRVRASASGEFRVAAEAERAGASLGRGEAGYAVEDASIEMDAVDLDDGRLAALAAATGGRYYHAPPTAEPVAADIRGAMAGLVRREETALVSTPLVFLLFVALTGAEWYLRRRRNLL